ncbi:hypothetical protein EDD16DRAFT_315724, partial [Pisolithus croceorrhizus]
MAWVRPLSYVLLALRRISNPIFVLQIRVIAVAAGVELEEHEYKHCEDNKQLRFLTMFPRGRIPAFEGADNFILTEGAAIARYSTYGFRIRDAWIVGWKEGKYIGSYPCRNSLSTDSGISDHCHPFCQKRVGERYLQIAHRCFD